MTRRLLLAVSPGEIWAALLEDGELSALRLTRTHAAPQRGDLYLGRVVAVRPELPAVLVDIGGERPAFLDGEHIPRGVKPRDGEAVVVKVTKAARADKAATLSMKLDADELKIAPAGAPPKLLRRRETALATLLRIFAADEIVTDDTAMLAEIKRLSGVPAILHAGATPLFEAEGVSIESALAPRVALPKDGAITIETASAATLIDVDGGRGGAPAANLAAAREIARQIRLRDLSGPIIIDFIGMKERDARDRVAASLKHALGEGAEYLGWTRLGHYELVVKRGRASLPELLFEHGASVTKTPLTVALEALRQVHRDSRAAPGKRLGLKVHPEVAAALDGAAAEARRELEAWLGYRVAVAVEARPRDSFTVAPL
jgi:Ribonuclease G/E